ncbi:NUDIX domain-containing protein [Acidisoma sp.]|uniref:NUDIX domain-containing protein n=1 Tax=Acidisoma sp. TaxID=1872115 RepID=UPI003B00B514
MGQHPRVGCGAAIVRDGKLLLVQRLTEPEAGRWGLPGGKVDAFEPLHDAVRREIEEELGIVIEDAGLLCLVELIDRDGDEHWVAPVYRVAAFSGEPENREPAKHARFGWFTLDALPANLTVAAAQAATAL